jgi:hypothetical protein
MSAAGTPSGTAQRVTQLLAAAASADRDADSEWPGSYYRKAHRARARRLRRQAANLQASLHAEEAPLAGTIAGYPKISYRTIDAARHVYEVRVQDKPRGG